MITYGLQSRHQASAAASAMLVNDGSTFEGIKPGDSVAYLTPSGEYRTGRACLFLTFATHVVVAERRTGRPVVVNRTNYISHKRTRGSK